MTTELVAQGIIAISFISFFVMTYVMYTQLMLQAWRAMFMSGAVVVILLVIMHRSTTILTMAREQAIIENPEDPGAENAAP